MNRQEAELRERLAESLFSLAEKIIRREGEFASIPLFIEKSTSWLAKYHKYLNELDPNMCESILQAILNSVRQNIFASLMVPDSSTTGKVTVKNTLDFFRDWIEKREGPIDYRIYMREPMGKLHFSKVIKEKVKIALPEYKFNSTISGKGVYIFSKIFNLDYEINVVIDHLPLGKAFDVSIGLKKPLFNVNIGLLLSGRRIDFPYWKSGFQYSQIDVDATIDNLLIYLNNLLPIWETQIREVFESYKNDT